MAIEVNPRRLLTYYYDEEKDRLTLIEKEVEKMYIKEEEVKAGGYYNIYDEETGEIVGIEIVGYRRRMN